MMPRMRSHRILIACCTFALLAANGRYAQMWALQQQEEEAV